jgi:SAM-dependent methyltransferase
MKKALRYSAGAVALAVTLSFLRQRRRPMAHPPQLTFLFENPLVGAFVGPERLLGRLDFAPGMRVLDAGCGPGRLAIPLSRAVGPGGEVVAPDGQREMLEKLKRRLDAEDITNVRPLLAGLGEGVIREGSFHRIVLAMVPGEVGDRGAAPRGAPRGPRARRCPPRNGDLRRPGLPAARHRPPRGRGRGLPEVERVSGEDAEASHDPEARALTAEQASPESLAL